MMCGQRPLWSGCSIEKMTCGPKHSKLVLVPQTNQRSAKHVSCALTCLLCPPVHVCVCVFVTTQSVGRRFGEFGGNLNNYTLCSPRVINYICGKGFLILESSTDKGWWWKRRARGAKKKRGKKEKRKKNPFVTDSGCTLDLSKNIFLLTGQLVPLGRDEEFATNRRFRVGIISCIWRSWQCTGHTFCGVAYSIWRGLVPFVHITAHHFSVSLIGVHQSCPCFLAGRLAKHTSLVGALGKRGVPLELAAWAMFKFVMMRLSMQYETASRRWQPNKTMLGCWVGGARENLKWLKWFFMFTQTGLTCQVSKNFHYHPDMQHVDCPRHKVSQPNIVPNCLHTFGYLLSSTLWINFFNAS